MKFFRRDMLFAVGKTAERFYGITSMRLLLTISLLLLTAPAFATPVLPAVECLIEIRQREIPTDNRVLLYSDTTTFILGIPRNGFPLAFSVDIELEAIDSIQTVFAVHVVTLGSSINNYAQRFRVEYGLPARLDGIIGKRGSEYQLTVIPLRPVEVDTTGCSCIHLGNKYFRFDPSAHLDIYYIEQTLGDFHWNGVKGLMEETYTRFKNLNRFSLPGKFALYLSPCDMNSVLWDKRFMMAVDPTRNSAYSVYASDFNSADPFLLWYLSTLKNYGYAPPILSEGFANYLSLGHYEMKKLLQSNVDMSLDFYFDTYAYLKADPVVADRISMSFVKYLVNEYKVDRFLDAYRAATDLNLRSVLEETYDKSIAQLEQEWRTYVDSVTFTAAQFIHQAEIAEAMRNYRKSLELFTLAYDLAGNAIDSMRTGSYVARSYFVNGDYYNAAEYQQRMIAGDSSIPIWYMTLAGYQMMNAEYLNALSNLETAHQLNPNNDVIRFNMALSYLFRGERREAIQLLQDIIVRPLDGSAEIEARVMLADGLLKSGNADDKQRAASLYQEVLAIYDQYGQPSAPSPIRQMWLGIAQLGVGDTGAAGDHLNTALLLESRPFYLGMINLWMGKLADMLGQHQAARNYYGLVIGQQSAAYHQVEARQYLETPYQQ